ncbi:MAG: immunoglobulin domain-containing protein, partial [Bacteroidales bacterium]
MLKYKYCFFVSLLYFLCLPTHAQFMLTSESVYSSGNYIVKDNDDNLYVGGEFICRMAMDTFNLYYENCDSTSFNPPLNFYLLKTNSEGKIEWGINSKISDDDDTYTVAGLATAAANGVYIAGTYNENMYFGDDTLATNSVNDLFISRVTTDGNVTGIKGGVTASPNAEIEISGIINDNLGNAMIYGSFKDTCIVGTDTIYSATSRLILIKCTPDLILSLHGYGIEIDSISSESRVTAATFNSINSLLVSIWASDTTGFVVDDTHSLNTSVNKTFLASISEMGNISILREDTVENVFAIKTDNADHIFIAGNYTSQVSVAGNQLIPTGSNETFIARLNSAGIPLWTLNSTGQDGSVSVTGSSIDIDDENNIFFCGNFGASSGVSGFQIGGENIESVDGLDGFAIKIGDDGSVLKMQTGGGIGDDEMKSLVVIDPLNVIVTGHFSDTVEIGEHLAVNRYGLMNMYTCTLDPYPSFVSEFTVHGNLAICENDSVQFSAVTGANYTYQWQKDSVDIPNEVLPVLNVKEHGSYRVVITNNDIPYTKRSQPAEVTVDSLPKPEISATGDTVFCEGSSVSLRCVSNKGNDYQWKRDGNLLTDSTNFILAANTGEYRVIESTPLGCTGISAPVTVQSVAFPSTEINVHGDLIFCDSDSVKLEATVGTGYLYQWYLDDELLPGDTIREPYLHEPGEYHCEVTGLAGCSSVSETISLSTLPTPDAEIKFNDDSVICEGETAMLSANSGLDLTYTWMRGEEIVAGETSSALITAQSGVYSVIVGYEGSCSARSEMKEVVVHSLPDPTITVSGSDNFCEGDTSFIFAIYNDNYTYEWYRNNIKEEEITSNVFTVTRGGEYHVRIINDSDCSIVSGKEGFIVRAAPGAPLFCDEDSIFCEGDSVKLYTHDLPMLSYQWKRDGSSLHGETNAVFHARNGGMYTFVVTDNTNNCSRESETYKLKEIPFPSETIQFEGSLSICEGDS